MTCVVRKKLVAPRGGGGRQVRQCLYPPLTTANCHDYVLQVLALDHSAGVIRLGHFRSYSSLSLDGVSFLITVDTTVFKCYNFVDRSAPHLKPMTHNQKPAPIYNADYYRTTLCSRCMLRQLCLSGCPSHGHTHVYTVFRKKHPLLFSCVTLTKSNQFQRKFQTK